MLPVAIRRGTNWPETNWLEREFGNLMRRFWSEDLPGGQLTGAYPVDIDEDEDSIRVEAELPGFTADQVDVTVDDGTLNITAERKPEESKGKKHLSERRFVRVERSFTLPTRVNEEQAEAKLDGGVLKLRLPKAAEAKPKRVPLK
jgi:HSP20 family protein